MKQHDLVEVVWDDARSLGGWITLEELTAWRDDHATRRIYSVGYVYSITKKTLCLVGSISHGDPIAFGDALEIPRAMIERVWLLRRGTRAGKAKRRGK